MENLTIKMHALRNILSGLKEQEQQLLELDDKIHEFEEKTKQALAIVAAQKQELKQQKMFVSRKVEGYYLEPSYSSSNHSSKRSRLEYEKTPTIVDVTDQEDDFDFVDMEDDNFIEKKPKEKQ